MPKMSGATSNRFMMPVVSMSNTLLPKIRKAPVLPGLLKMVKGTRQFVDAERRFSMGAQKGW